MYIIEYYYDLKEKLWRAEVLNEENKIKAYVYAPNEPAILQEVENLKSQYEVLSVKKVKFYK